VSSRGLLRNKSHQIASESRGTTYLATIIAFNNAIACMCACMCVSDECVEKGRGRFVSGCETSEITERQLCNECRATLRKNGQGK